MDSVRLLLVAGVGGGSDCLPTAYLNFKITDEKIKNSKILGHCLFKFRVNFNVAYKFFENTKVRNSSDTVPLTYKIRYSCITYKIKIKIKSLSALFQYNNVFK